MVIPGTLNDRARLVVADMEYQAEMIGLHTEEQMENTIRRHAIAEVAGDSDRLRDMVELILRARGGVQPRRR